MIEQSGQKITIVQCIFLSVTAAFEQISRCSYYCPTAVMAVQELSVHESLGSMSSASNHLWSLAQDTPTIVRVPYRILLDLMLEKIGVSKAEYHSELCEDNNVRVTVLFNTSTLPVEGPAVYRTVVGIQSKDYEIAEDSACANAITHIQQATNTVIGDFNYAPLKELKEQNESLLHQLRQSNEYKKHLARGWFLAVRDMYSFSQQILNVVHLNHTGEDSPVDRVWNTLLVNFQDMAFKLKRATRVLERRVEQMRMSSFS